MNLYFSFFKMALLNSLTINLQIKLCLVNSTLSTLYKSVPSAELTTLIRKKKSFLSEYRKRTNSCHIIDVGRVCFLIPVFPRREMTCGVLLVPFLK